MSGNTVPPRARCWVVLLSALGLLGGGDALAQGSSAPSAAAASLVRAALETMGGEATFRGLEGIRIEGVGHQYYLEQSERFEGPYLVDYQQFSELRDLRHGRMRQTMQRRSYNSPQFAGGTLVMADGVVAHEARGRDGGARMVPGRQDEVVAAERRLALAPERVLLRALEAPDLRAERDPVYYGVPQHVVAFGPRSERIRIFLNARTTLPTAVESRRAESGDYFWDVWGDVSFRTLFSLWVLEPGGLLYPRQWDVEWDGRPYSSTTVTALDPRAAVPADSFVIADTVRAAYRAALADARGPKTVGFGEFWGGGRPRPPIEELRPGVVFIPGGYNVVLVRQPDGIVILEAPFSSEYSAKVLDEVKRRYPDVPVKGVVSTGDAWTYLGGAREYVARGIPLYALGLNRPILERVIRARHDIDPDSLAHRPRKADLRWVNGKTVLGSGPNRMELYPVDGEAGERMMLVYFPEHRLLWTSDLVQGPGRDGTFFMPEYLLEAQWVVKRERLDVETVVGMHNRPTPWSRITAALDAQRRPDSSGAGRQE